MLSVHDNEPYAYVVSLLSKRVVLHTVSPGAIPAYIDVVFSGVATFQFDEVNMGQNVLLRIVELTPNAFYEQFPKHFAPRDIGGIVHGYSWLPFRYRNQDEFISRVAERDLRCFDIQTSMGLNGFVICKQCEIVSRAERAPAA